MANIFSYIDRHGDETFDELEFNELDAVIFAGLSYISFDGIVSRRDHKIVLEKAGLEFFALYSKEELKKNIVGIVDCIQIFEKIKSKKRYKDLLLYNYVFEAGKEKQFSALCIDIDEKNTYISFEGTDDLISGWKEDFCMAYKFPVDGHVSAIKYINNTISIFSDKKYILGGHSKGGNMALVSAMYANPLVRRKIKKIYSFDGPGLKKKQIESRFYNKISDRYEHIIPNYSVIGLLLRSYKNKVIESSKKDLYAHSISSWQVDDTEFRKANLSEFSIGLDNTITKWLYKYSNEEKEKMFNDLFTIFEKSGINSVKDVMDSKIVSVFHLIKNAKNMNSSSKETLTELVKFIFKYVKDYGLNKINNKKSE